MAALEYFVHLDAADTPTDLVAVPAEIPDELARSKIAVDTLPPTWRQYPAPDLLADLGVSWLRAGRTAVLVVPSAIVPQEQNLLLNPAHRGFRAIRLGTPQPFSFDPRLWKH